MRDARWTAADARRDASDQTEDMNAARRDEAASQRDQDWLDTQDERMPTRAELDDFDDWHQAQESDRPDPWGDPPITPRERPTFTPNPPF